MWRCVIKEDVKCFEDDTLAQCLQKATLFSIAEIPVVTSNNILKGIIELSSIAKSIGNILGKFDKIKCSEICTTPRLVITIDEDPPLNSIIQNMINNNVIVAPVIGPKNLFRGVIILRELLKSLVNKKLYSQKITDDIISKRAALLGDDENLIQAIEILTHRGELCGIVYNGYEVSSMMCLTEALSVSTSMSIDNIENYLVEHASRKPVFIHINDSIGAAIDALNEHQVDMLIVKDNYDNVIGVIPIIKIALKLLKLLKGEYK